MMKLVNMLGLGSSSLIKRVRVQIPFLVKIKIKYFLVNFIEKPYANKVACMVLRNTFFEKITTVKFRRCFWYVRWNLLLV